MNKLIFIIGESDDPQVVALVSHLNDCDIVYFNSNTRSDFTIYHQPNIDATEVYCCNQVLLPDAVFWRSLDYDAFEYEQDPANGDAYIELFLHAFSDALWMNPPPAFHEHSTKIKQIRTALDNDILMPNTVMTNDVDDAIRFLEQNGPLALKPIAGGEYTIKIKKEKQLRKYFKEHSQPVCLQEFIEGDCIRTFVIGDICYSTIIFSKGSDFRVDDDAEYYGIELGECLNTTAVEITEKLGMHWTAIDWIRSKDGQFYFLEANFSPMFANYETLAMQPISQKIANYILDTIKRV